MNEFANIFFLKRRYLIASVSFIIIMLLLAPVLQAHNANITAQVEASYAGQSTQTAYTETPNAVTNTFSALGHGTGRALNTVKVKTLRGILQTTAGATLFDRATMEVGKNIASLAYNGLGTVATFAFHAAWGGVAFTGHIVGDTLLFSGHMIGDCFGFMGHIFGDSFRFVSHVTHVSAIIRPPDHTPAPTITQMRAQQASLIQSGTIGAIVPQSQSSLTYSTTGGACDSGEGNGGYPMSWCNAPMDSIATLLFNNDPINRECTSYADWYFTTVEGYTDFQAWGNAKYWANTTNFPTQMTPAVGAIAVETTGAYGHVAIVQALPGQKYAGAVVPAGYILVSEMNYDWNGHFRYSYSPLSKFTAYIVP